MRSRAPSCPFDGRLRIINEQVKPGYARLRAEASAAGMIGGLSAAARSVYPQRAE